MILYHKNPYIEIKIEYSEADQYLDSIKFYIKDEELDNMESIIDSHDWMIFQYEISPTEKLLFEGVVSNFFHDNKLDLWVLYLGLYDVIKSENCADWVVYQKRMGGIDNLLK